MVCHTDIPELYLQLANEGGCTNDLSEGLTFQRVNLIFCFRLSSLLVIADSLKRSSLGKSWCLQQD